MKGDTKVSVAFEQKKSGMRLFPHPLKNIKKKKLKTMSTKNVESREIRLITPIAFENGQHVFPQQS